jgi:hypothetical protein
MTRWPPILWPLMALASLLILIGLSSLDAEALIPGTGLAVAVLAVALYLAVGKRDDRPMTRRVPMAIAGVVIFYAIAVAVAAVAGWQYAGVAILASFFPLAAASLLIATTRTKSTGSDRRPDDVTATNREDGLPGIGMDSETPLGDTPEHSTAERVAKPDTRFNRAGTSAGRH